ncbi:MAG: RNA degradosome polyphosphate kinase [Candidatus Puniceispirillum sp.]|nr:RNA degradosome polyphosphate kinase [Candidatus Puniceispirillum sp.]MDC6458007.1 RNA degradosome polyphosphate kinase [Alphaproteobacteria bacterium]MDP4632480.1 RNA degradosome polyphosphate kinase [Porticoccaceae bacterium]
MKSKKTDPILDGSTEDESFFNRELSWLAFNERVLSLAEDDDKPLGERIRFLAISADNLNEFFMVRVAGLRQLVDRGFKRLPKDDVDIDQLLTQIMARSAKLMARQNQVLPELIGCLRDQNIHVLSDIPDDEQDRLWLEDWFIDNVLPLITPTTLDPSHPFPFFHNDGKGMMLELTSPDSKPMQSVILLPANLPRFVKLPGDGLRLLLVEAVIRASIVKIYPRHRLVSAAMFSILRDSEIEIDDEANDLIHEFETALRARQRGNVVLLTLSKDAPKPIRRLLKSAMGIGENNFFNTDGPVALNNFSELLDYIPKHLLFPAFAPRFPQRIRDFNGDCFAAIRNKDIIVHHPYESFEVVVRYLQQAATDPDVLAIRQTLYRTTSNSPIVKALIQAAENGKTVTAVIELKARFDERNNIQLARALGRAGVQVAYGLTDLKIHLKMSLVVRREHGKLVSYTHVGTGNYHPITAGIYTDLSYFTCDKDVGRDAYEIFKYLTSHVQPDKLKRSFISPHQSTPQLKLMIRAEIENCKNGLPSGVWLKCNSLVDHRLIELLYEASQAGVPIEIVARGICCLRPGVAGLSETITVRSIIGRFLEHGRIYVFANGGEFLSDKNTVMISSADLMPRNLRRRVECFMWLENPTIRKQVLHQIMVAHLRDEKNAWYLQPDGSYVHPQTDETSFSCHEYFMSNPSLSGLGSLAATQDNG